MAGPNSRRRLLEAGVELLAAGGVRMVTGALPAQAVCDQAGLTRRTYYDHFPTTEDFADALQQYLSDAIRPVDGVGAESLVERGDLHATVSDIVARYCERRASSAAPWVARGLAVMEASTTSPDVLGEWDAVVTGLDVLGFSPRAPLSTADVAHAVGAAVEAIVRPGGSTDHETRATAVEVAVAVLASLVVYRASRDEIPPAEALAQQVSAVWREREASTSIVNVRRLVLGAAAHELRERGAFGFSLAALSRRTGLSTSAVARHIGGADEILAALVDECVAGLDVAVQADAAARLQPDAVRERHLSRFAEHLAVQPEIAQALVSLGLTRPRGTGGIGTMDGALTTWARLMRCERDELWRQQLACVVRVLVEVGARPPSQR